MKVVEMAYRTQNFPAFCRRFSSETKDTFFVTTPIYYVNARPHLGHLYTSVIADAIARWRRIVDSAGRFKLSTGTDEHGSKIQQAAERNRTSPANYCNEISREYQNLASLFSVDYTDFVRTSDQRHCEAVHKFWNVLKDGGKIFSAKYGGWYCVSDESFLSSVQVKEISGPKGAKTMVSAESGHPVEWLEEVNYMFPLRTFQDDLIYWIRSNEGAVRPAKFLKILLDTLEAGPLPDLSVSRPTSRVHWGVRVPDDETQTVYVWLDALVNYLTVAGYSGNGEEFGRNWPPDVQVIGKDILKFHGIYWPAFLMAAGLDPPRTLLCHSHWTVDGEKMSKSKNNVVCPVEKSSICSADGLRYFLLREGVAHSDGNYSNTKMIRILNSELADTLGNLLNRSCGSVLNPDQSFPEILPEAFQAVSALDVTKTLIDAVTDLPDVCTQHYAAYDFHKVADSVIAVLHRANLFFETLRPWELRKENSDFERLNVVLHITLETLRICGVLLQPIIPNIASGLLDKLNVAKERRSLEDAMRRSWDEERFVRRSLGARKEPLFRRIAVEGGKTKARR